MKQGKETAEKLINKFIEDGKEPETVRKYAVLGIFYAVSALGEEVLLCFGIRLVFKEEK